MTAQKQIFVPPKLPDAKKGVLYVSTLLDPVPCIVDQYQLAAEKHIVELWVMISGNQWHHSIELGPHPIFPIQFDIPKRIFSVPLVPGSKAELHYTITKGISTVISPTLTVDIKP